jgi:hypothetical protein
VRSGSQRHSDIRAGLTLLPATSRTSGAARLTRRRLLGAAALAGAAALVDACGGRSSTTSITGPEPPPCRPGPAGAIFWNTSSTANLDPGYYGYTRALEQQLGRRFAGIRKNYWPGDGAPEISPEIAAAYAAGRRWTYMNGKPDQRPPDGDVTRWSSVAGGIYDGDFSRLFDAVRRDPRWTADAPFRFSFHHEQNVTAEQGGRLAGTPEDYRAAFRRVRRLMDESGAHVSAGGNMLMCWSPDWLQIARDGDPSWPGYPYDATSCDPAGPGPAHGVYDLLGCDVYRRSGMQFRAEEMWAPVQAWAKRRGVPFFAGECGVAWTPAETGSVVRYLDDLERLLDGWRGEGAGACAAVCWTSRRAQGGDYRLDADPHVLRRYRALARTPLFAGCQSA